MGENVVQDSECIAFTVGRVTADTTLMLGDHRAQVELMIGYRDRYVLPGF